MPSLPLVLPRGLYCLYALACRTRYGSACIQDGLPHSAALCMPAARACQPSRATMPLPQHCDIAEHGSQFNALPATRLLAHVYRLTLPALFGTS